MKRLPGPSAAPRRAARTAARRRHAAKPILPARTAAARLHEPPHTGTER